MLNNSIKKHNGIKKIIPLFICILALISLFIFTQLLSLNNKSKITSTKKIKTSTSKIATSPRKNPLKVDSSKINLSVAAYNKTTSNASQSLSDARKQNIPSYGVKVEDAFKEDGKKTAYLTFDDGPSTTVTPKILNTLKIYNAHATFFLLGQVIEQNPNSKNLVKRIFEEGNSIGNHTYSHNLKLLYPNNVLNISQFMSEVDKTSNILKGILGQAFSTRVIRMPGGYMSRVYYKDPNLQSFKNVLAQRNMVSIDWNAYDFDAEGKRKNADELLEHVKSTVANKNKVVILMHDTYGKEETAKALPMIIEYLKSTGYEFKTLY